MVTNYISVNIIDPSCHDVVLDGSKILFFGKCLVYLCIYSLTCQKV